MEIKFKYLYCVAAFCFGGGLASTGIPWYGFLLFTIASGILVVLSLGHRFEEKISW